MQKMGPIWEACLKSDKMEKYVIAVLEKEQKKKEKKILHDGISLQTTWNFDTHTDPYDDVNAGR